MKRYIVIIFTCILFAGYGWSEPLSFLKTKGKIIINEKEEKVSLYGFNLGNWLLVEPWMLKIDDPDHIKAGLDIFNIFKDRFGKKRSKDLYDTYMKNYVVESDIEYLSSLGINFVRIPFWYKALFDPQYTPHDMYYLDNVIKWCKKYGIYALIDLHGAPGGQSKENGILGERMENELWTSSKYLDETVDVWKKIAERYKDEKTVAGYDLLNEAMHPPSYERLIEVYDLLYNTIRKIDKKHIIFIEDALQGIHRLPHPDNMGWKNVVYSFHFYPTFNSADDMEKIKYMEQVFLPNLSRAQEFFNVPFHVGEFNSMTIYKGGLDHLYRYISIFRNYDWSWNIWNYKKIEDDHNVLWGLTGYMDELTPPDISNITYEDAEKLVQSFHSSKVKINKMYESMIKIAVNDYRSPKKKEEIDKIILNPVNGYLHRAVNGAIRVEWGKRKPNFGYWGEGDAVYWKITVQKDGFYKVNLNYSSQVDGGVVRLLIDHYKYAELELNRTKGGWEGYLDKRVDAVKLTRGEHHVRLEGIYSKDGIMNLREITFEQVMDADQNALLKPSDEEIILHAVDVSKLVRKMGICVEWQNDPPNIGYMNDGESFEWQIRSPVDAEYRMQLRYSAKFADARFKVYLNDEMIDEIDADATGGWFNFVSLKAGKVDIRKGINRIKFSVIAPPSEGAGNVAWLKLNKEK